MQQKINNLQEALHNVMKIKKMVGYPDNFKLGSTSTDTTLNVLQNLIAILIEILKEVNAARPIVHIFCVQIVIHKGIMLQNV